MKNSRNCECEISDRISESIKWSESGQASRTEVEIRSNALSAVFAIPLGRRDVHKCHVRVKITRPVVLRFFALKNLCRCLSRNAVPRAGGIGVDIKNFPRISLDSLPHACILHLSLSLSFTYSFSRARRNKITPTCRTRAAGSPSPCWYRRKEGDRERPDWERRQERRCEEKGRGDWLNPSTRERRDSQQAMRDQIQPNPIAGSPAKRTSERANVRTGRLGRRAVRTRQRRSYGHMGNDTAQEGGKGKTRACAPRQFIEP